jgi:hypothetical protein
MYGAQAEAGGIKERKIRKKNVKNKTFPLDHWRKPDFSAKRHNI